MLITAGPTREFIDPIRIITNPSSGKMGIALAEEALERGAKVLLVYGPGSARPPERVDVVKVQTTEEMYRTVKDELSKNHYDMVILAAATLDYGPNKSADYKISSSLRELVIKLRPLPKVSSIVKEVSPKSFFIGFKAEHNVTDEELIDRAYQRLRDTGMDLVVANDVGRNGVGFSSDTNEVYIIDKDKRITHVPLSSKREIAKEILNVALGL